MSMHASDDRVDDGRKETKQRNVNGREPCMVAGIYGYGACGTCMGRAPLKN
jgi:hypothetical protein